MLRFFRKQNITNPDTLFVMDSHEKVKHYSLFQTECILKINTILESIEEPQNNIGMFTSLLHMIQIDQDCLVNIYIKYVSKDGNHYNQDFIYSWLAKFYFQFDEPEKSIYYTNLILDTKRRDYLISEFNACTYKQIINVEFASLREYNVQDEVKDFFSIDRTPKDIKKFIDSVIAIEEEKTKGKDNRLWNLAYYFEKVVFYLVNENKIDCALEILKEFPQKAPKWNALRKLALEIGKNDMQSALKITNQIKDIQVKGNTIFSLALGCYSPSDYSESLAIIENLPSSKKKYVSTFYTRLIEKLISDKQLENAKKVLDQIDMKESSDLYDSLIFIGTSDLFGNDQTSAIGFVSYLQGADDKIKYLSALFCIESVLSKGQNKCLINYFLPYRFQGHEVEFWKVFNNY